VTAPSSPREYEKAPTGRAGLARRRSASWASTVIVGSVDVAVNANVGVIVDVIVTSEEFRSINKTVEFDRLPRDRDRRSGYSH